MRKALLVDYGGVLTTSIASSFKAFCADEGITVDAFRRAVFDDALDAASPIAQVETGVITQDAFDELVAERLRAASGLPIASAGLKERMFAGVRPDVAMRSAVRQARAAGVPTVLVSNSWGGDDYPLEELSPLFDVMLISGKIGLRKPEPEIYLRAAAEAGCEPTGCVFVDDLNHNVAGARAVGMHGVLHRDAAATRAQLEPFLGLTFRA